MKTIQMVVSQRMLPLRCVICRAKVLRLKQTTSGGLSTGHVRSNSKNLLQSMLQPPSPRVVSRPMSLVPCCPMQTMPMDIYTSIPPSPVTEVFQAQKAIYQMSMKPNMADHSNDMGHFADSDDSANMQVVQVDSLLNGEEAKASVDYSDNQIRVDLSEVSAYAINTSVCLSLIAQFKATFFIAQYLGK